MEDNNFKPRIPKNPTLKSLFEITGKKFKEDIPQRDYVPIIVAATISSATSWYLSQYDFTSKTITGTQIFDVLIIGLITSLVLFTIILVSLNIARFFNRLTYFFELCWKNWRPFKKIKKKE